MTPKTEKVGGEGASENRVLDFDWLSSADHVTRAHAHEKRRCAPRSSKRSEFSLPRSSRTSVIIHTCTGTSGGEPLVAYTQRSNPHITLFIESVRGSFISLSLSLSFSLLRRCVSFIALGAERAAAGHCTAARHVAKRSWNIDARREIDAHFYSTSIFVFIREILVAATSAALTNS